jgi:phosphopantothenoylcysteine decarboxylase/phosphopantothenate--cysteine ligase
MHAAVKAALPADIAVLVAAVADWRAEAAPTKIKKGNTLPTLTLIENPDILADIAQPGPLRPRVVVGFAAETDAVLENATAKLAKKGCDLIVANDVSGDVMGGDRNRVHLVTPLGIETLAEAEKTAIARLLARRIAGLFDG